MCPPGHPGGSEPAAGSAAEAIPAAVPVYEAGPASGLWITFRSASTLFSPGSSRFGAGAESSTPLIYAVETGVPESGREYLSSKQMQIQIDICFDAHARCACRRVIVYTFDGCSDVSLGLAHFIMAGRQSGRPKCKLTG